MRLASSTPIILCLGCLALAGCKEEAETEVHDVIRPVRAVVVDPQVSQRIAQGSGRITARYVSEVGFEVGGRLISRRVDVGTVVTKGQMIAELSAVDFRNQVTIAEAELDRAEAVLAQTAAQEDRDRALSLKGHKSAAAYDDSLRAMYTAKADVRSAEANLEIARNQLDYTRLVAPIDGVVTATSADPGQIVDAGQMVVEISRDTEREAVFAVASEDIAHASVGTPVTVWLQSNPEVKTAGAVREISPVASGTTGTFEVRVTLPSAPRDMRLGSVVVGRAEAEGRKVTTLPSAALLQTGEIPQVWVVAADNTVHRREVDLVEFDMETVVVGKGLTAGERVVTAGVNALAEGESVKLETEVE